MKKTILALILITLTTQLLCLPIQYNNTLSAQPIVGEDDIYQKEVELGTTTQFYWVVYRNTTTNYSVAVTIDGFNTWDTTITPSNFVLSKEHPYQTVTIEVTTPNFPEQDYREATIYFTFRELASTQKYSEEKTASITIIGLSYQGEENTILGGLPNPLPPPLNIPLGAFILNIGLWLIISIVTYLIIRYGIHRLAKKTKTKLDDAIVDILRRPIIILIILYGAITSIIRFGISLDLKETLYQIFNVIVLGIVIYALYRIYIEILEDIAKRRGGKKSTFSRVVKPVFRKLGAVVIIIGGLMYGLSVMGVEITALLAGAGVFGLVIAFAAQDTLSNFFSGIHLLLDRPFHIGDLILIEGGEYCRVENVGMRSTKLYSIFDHELIVLPNNNLANQKIINIVQPDTRIKKKIELGVAYGSDVEKVKKILMDSAMNHPNVVKEEDLMPFVRFTGFGDSSLDFLLIFTVDDVYNQWKTRSDIITEIDSQFRKQKVTIPFPQRTLWINEMKKKK